MRAALAVISYPPNGPPDGIEALVADWGPDEMADYVAASQVIFEALADACGPGAVAAVVDALRRQSLELD